MAFAEMTFNNQIASIKKRGNTLAGDIQTVIVRAHVEYVQGRPDNPDYDAVARVLNAVKVFQLRSAHTIAQYFAEHGPYKVDYRKDKKSGLKKFFCKKDEHGADFKEMTVQWNDWDAPKAEQEMFNSHNLLKMLKSAANSDRYDTASRSLATTLANQAELAIREAQDTAEAAA